MNTKNNRRKRESKEKIKKVFINLIQTRELNQISVSDICKRAELNRTTFYANYSDIYELAAQRMALPAQDCAVYEDILKGVEGAKAGGFLAVAIEEPHSGYEKEPLLEMADIYINSWKELLK